MLEMPESSSPYLSKEDHTAFHFLDIWYKNSRPSNESEGEGEKSPTALSSVNIPRKYIEFDPDGICVWYSGGIWQAVRANRPAPWKRPLYYFEIFVKDAGYEGAVAIGLTSASFYLGDPPGWEENSYGYHGDGSLYPGQADPEPLAESFTTGDFVGCGVNNATQQLFFTKNGSIVETAKKEVEGPMFPTVAVLGQNVEIHVNFGRHPFVFDLEEYEADHRAEVQQVFDEMEIPQDASYAIIRSYLQHYGYEQTLQSFDMDTNSVMHPIEEDNMYALNQRSTIRQMIMRGEVDDAFSKVQEWFPQTIKSDVSGICFFLRSQKFVELVRDGKISDARAYSISELYKFQDLKMVGPQLEDCFTLLNDVRPQESNAGYLLEESHRELVADAVNAVILSTNPNVKDEKNCMESSLERLIRQLTACCSWGEAFDLQRFMENRKK